MGYAGLKTSSNIGHGRLKTRSRGHLVHFKHCAWSPLFFVNTTCKIFCVNAAVGVFVTSLTALVLFDAEIWVPSKLKYP